MPNSEMDAIEVHHAVVVLQRALSPRIKLLGQCVVETAYGASAGRDSHQRLSDITNFMGTDPTHKHLSQSRGDLGFIPTVALKGLGVKLPFAISGDAEILDATSCSDQITGGRPISVAFAFWGTLAPGGSDKAFQFFTHDFFHHDLCGLADLTAKILMKVLLGWHA